MLPACERREVSELVVAGERNDEVGAGERGEENVGKLGSGEQ